MMSPIEVAYQFRQKIFKPSAVKIYVERPGHHLSTQQAK